MPSLWRQKEIRRNNSLVAPPSSAYLDVGGLVEAVHLVEQLEEDSLDLAVGARLRVEALRRDGVDLGTDVMISKIFSSKKWGENSLIF
jgi:hypothetical protein